MRNLTKIFGTPEKVKSLMQRLFDAEESDQPVENINELVAMIAREERSLAVGIIDEIKNLESISEMIQTREKELASKRKRIEKYIDDMKKGLLLYADGEKVQLDMYTISSRKSESITFNGDENALLSLKIDHPELVREKIVREIDKVAVKNLIKTTGEIPDGVEITTKESLVIK